MSRTRAFRRSRCFLYAYPMISLCHSPFFKLAGQNGCDFFWMSDPASNFLSVRAFFGKTSDLSNVALIEALSEFFYNGFVEVMQETLCVGIIKDVESNAPHKQLFLANL